MLNKLRELRASRCEEGFTLTELLIVIVIIGVLAGIALPLFLNQQKAAADAAVKSDVRNTAINASTELVKHPTSEDLSGVEPTRSNDDTTVTIRGSWQNYVVRGENVSAESCHEWYSALGTLSPCLAQGETPPTGPVGGGSQLKSDIKAEVNAAYARAKAALAAGTFHFEMLGQDSNGEWVGIADWSTGFDAEHPDAAQAFGQISGEWWYGCNSTNYLFEDVPECYEYACRQRSNLRPMRRLESRPLVRGLSLPGSRF